MIVFFLSIATLAWRFSEKECLSADASETCAVSRAPGVAMDSVLLQRSFKQMDLQVSDVDAFGEYDCNGDGRQDCGWWDHGASMCGNRVYCGHQFRMGDWRLHDSCRCRRCHSDEFYGTAFADANLQWPQPPFLNALPWGTFRVWADHLDTCAPWLMPRTDEDLRAVLAYARRRGYKVRISGAAHSAGGLVTDGRDSSAFVISLGEYRAPGEWEFAMRDMPDGSARATVNAGWTQAHLFARIRPLGFFVPAQTAGYFFQLGGIVANSVHGGGYNAGFIHSYTTRFRVMTFDGSIRVIEDEEEMRFWRCSFGLLGIILGVEFQLERRSDLQMYTVAKKMPALSEKEFWRFITLSAEADLPEGVVPDAETGSRKSWNGEYFVDWMSDGDFPTIAVYAQKANASADWAFEGELGVPAGVNESYRELLEERVDDELHGRMSWGEAARRDGAPPIKVVGVDVNDLLHRFRAFHLAKTMSMAAITNIPRLVREQSKKLNDGFFLTRSPAALAGAFFVHPSKAFAAMDKLREVQRASVGSEDFVWNLPGEFRFLRVQDSAVLQPVPAGLWFNCQMISFPDLARNEQAWKRDFKAVEDYWVNELGAKPHMGKVWGLDATSQGTIEPFSDAAACSVYSDATKAKFNEYRQRVDPEGLFFSGLGVKLLGTCE